MQLPIAKQLKASKSDLDPQVSTPTLAPPSTWWGFFVAMVYQPSKQHLDQHIPEACQAVNKILRELKKETGADDRFIARILEGLSRQWTEDLNRDGFGFR